MPLQILLFLLVCLALTVVSESLVVLLLFRNGRFVYYSLLANLLTNPALNLLRLLSLGFFGRAWDVPVLAALELAAVLAEAAVYRRLCDFTALKALAVSLLLNAASFALGLALSGVIPVP
jgi:hypothetical protein